MTTRASTASPSVPLTTPQRAVPFLDLARETREVLPAAEEALSRVLRSGGYVLGPEVEAFEREVAAFLGVRHAVGVNSGTDALVLALRALGVGPGDEVVTSPFSFLATATAVLHAGARPVFADIDPGTFQLDPARAAACITPRTRALLPVALFGQPADMDAFRDLARSRGLHVVEDAAQALGARLRARRVGALGDVAAFSFYPTKNLGGFGDGGLLTTDDDDVAAAARALRSHGLAPVVERGAPPAPGVNSRLDELQAALLRVKLPRLDGWNARRRENARRYDDALRGVPGITVPAALPGAEHTYHQYAVRVAGGRRDALRDALAAAGVETRVYYATPLHRHALFAADAPSLPHAERAAREVLSLPVSPGLTRADQERCIDVVRRFARSRSGAPREGPSA